MLTEERVDRQLINHEKRLDELDTKGMETSTRLATLEKQVDFFVKENLPPSEGILNAKSWWSGYEFAYLENQCYSQTLYPTLEK